MNPLLQTNWLQQGVYNYSHSTQACMMLFLALSG